MDVILEKLLDLGGTVVVVWLFLHKIPSLDQVELMAKNLIDYARK